MTFRAFLVAIALALAVHAAACSGGGSGGTGGAAGGSAGRGGGGGSSPGSGGAGGCSEISVTQTITSTAGAPGHTNTRCLSFPAACASDPHCACVCPTSTSCYSVSGGCTCTEVNGVVSVRCISD